MSRVGSQRRFLARRGGGEGIHQSHHRIPAPSVSAIDANSIAEMVKRARIAFTKASLSESSVASCRTGGWAVSRGRPLALRPRFATGLPWTVLQRRTIALDRNLRALRTRTYGAEVPGRPPFGGVVGKHRPAGPHPLAP